MNDLVKDSLAGGITAAASLSENQIITIAAAIGAPAISSVTVDFASRALSKWQSSRLLKGVQIIAKKIGFYPMDMENDNWVEFIESTDNLSDADIDSGFSTDYGGYPIICIASNQEDLNSIQEDSLQFTDTPTFYRRKRNSIIVLNGAKNI